MSKNSVLVLLLTLTFIPIPASRAQQPKKIPRVGFLSPGASPKSDFRYKAYQEGLRELGYVEGKNITIDYRGADGTTDIYKALPAELVSRKVDIVVTASQVAVLAAKTASKTIPIVMVAGDDPVKSALSQASHGRVKTSRD